MSASILFLKTVCSHCRNKAQHCNYCSNTGHIYIEAADVVIAQWLLEQDDKSKKYFSAVLSGKSALQDSQD